MKWLKKYLIFKEDIDVNDSDNIDVKAAKISFNDVKKHIEEYKSKKSQVDAIFDKDIDKEQLDKEIESLLGSSYSEDDSSERNPFLVNYIQVANDQKRLDNLLDDVVTDRESLQSNRSLLSNVDDNDQKESLEGTIKTISDRIQNSQKSIEILRRDISENEKKISDKMDETEKEILNNISNIENTRK